MRHISARPTRMCSEVYSSPHQNKCNLIRSLINSEHDEIEICTYVCSAIKRPVIAFTLFFWECGNSRAYIMAQAFQICKYNIWLDQHFVHHHLPPRPVPSRLSVSLFCDANICTFYAVIIGEPLLTFSRLILTRFGHFIGLRHNVLMIFGFHLWSKFSCVTIYCKFIEKLDAVCHACPRHTHTEGKKSRERENILTKIVLLAEKKWLIIIGCSSRSIQLK